MTKNMRSVYLSLALSFVCQVSFADELKDIRGPVSIPGDFPWMWLLMGLGPLAAIYLLILKSRRETVVRPVVIRPPWEVALSELRELADGTYISAEEIKYFYSRLSEIVRFYIEQRFQIRAPEMTTEEFMEKVLHSPALNENQKQALHGLLSASDLVKFARRFPQAQEMEDVCRLAEQFVNETKGDSTVRST